MPKLIRVETKGLLMFFAGWVHRGQLEVIDYLKEENRVLREQLGGRGCGSPTTSARLVPKSIRAEAKSCSHLGQGRPATFDQKRQ